VASPNQNISALFERFRSPTERPVPKALDPERILALKGNANNGAALLFPAGKLAGCFACHKVRNHGGQLGPELNQVGARLNRNQLLESLLHPSKTIAPEFQLTIVETNSDEIYSGFLVEQDDDHVMMKLATGQTKSISADNINAARPRQISLMPEGLLNLLTEQEVADLLAYLETLNQAEAK
jgi:putative heme-binding domain-containing protein